MLPRENLYRACMPGAELRAASGGDGGMPTLYGHFSVFDTPTTIRSAYEGEFIERIAPGAFAKSIKERANQIKVMFNHGRDPQIGEKPLGPLQVLREDEVGGYYEAPLLDTSYNRDLVPALEAGLLGASFRFSVMREDVNKNPKRSAANPDGLPERTILEAKLFELGPVVNPAYATATAGVRSITDDIMDIDALVRATPILLDEERTERARVFLSRDLPDLSALATPGATEDPIDAERADGPCETCVDGECTCAERADAETAPSNESAEPAAEQAHPVPERRTALTHRKPRLYGLGQEEKPRWLLPKKSG